MATTKSTPPVVEDTPVEIPSPVPVESSSVAFVPACPGSAGSQPFLTDIQAQLNENYNAGREGREPLIVPVQCRLCDNYHIENQKSPDYVSLDDFGYKHIQPPSQEDVTPGAEILLTAVEALGTGNDDTV